MFEASYADMIGSFKRLVTQTSEFVPDSPFFQLSPYLMVQICAYGKTFLLEGCLVSASMLPGDMGVGESQPIDIPPSPVPMAQVGLLLVGVYSIVAHQDIHAIYSNRCGISLLVPLGGIVSPDWCCFWK